MTKQLSAFIKFAFKNFPGQFCKFLSCWLAFVTKRKLKFNVASKFNYITAVLLSSD